MAHWSCSECGRDYAYQLDSCTWCGTGLLKHDPSSGGIVVVTEVNVPSVGHEDVPYWCAYVRADDGSHTIVKLDHPVEVGDRLPIHGVEGLELAVVGVLGSGTMGRGLVELFLSRGHRVVWCGRAVGRLASSRRRLLERLGRIMDTDEIAEADARLSLCTDYTLLEECDAVVEAVVEETGPKQAVLGAAEACMRSDAFLTSNTSGLSIDELASALQRPERFGVLHFFNPPTRMRLVETAIGSAASPETGEFLDTFARSLGKIPVRVAAKPAFAVNRALMPLLNEAVRELEEGVASAESIDEAVRLGLNHPMGPLALADLIGLDVVVDIMDNLARRTGDDTYAPRPMLRALVGAGQLGRKSGEGFYKYDR